MHRIRAKRRAVAAAILAAAAIQTLAQTESAKPHDAARTDAATPRLLGNYFRADGLRIISGQPLRLRFLTALDSAAKPANWPPTGLEWVFVRGEGTQANLHFVKPMPGSDTVEIALEPAGWQMVGIDTKGAVQRVARDAMEARLKSAGAGIPLGVSAGAARAAGFVRVRHTESAKIIVHVEPPAGAAPVPETAAVAMSKSGQAAEIRLMTDPTTAGVGDLIAFCTYVNGINQSDVRVVARNLDAKREAPISPGGGGISSFRISAAGTWLLDFTFAEIADENADADWFTYHATLAFETGISATAKGAGK